MQTSPIRLLSTKILEGDIISDAMASGIEMSCIPLIKISTIQDDHLKDRLIQLSARNIRAIFTSSNAVKALQELMPHAPEWTYSALEGNTLKSAISYFGLQRKVVVGHDGISLAKGLVAEGDSLDKFFFCGNKRLDVLPNYFNEHGVPLEQIVVYKNESIKKKITEKFSGILFFSPSAVENFYSENIIEADTVLFAFGETTKKALQTHSKNKIILNDVPTQAAFLEKIKTYYKHE